MIKLSIGDPETLRSIQDDPQFVSEELFKATSNGHKFKVGDVCTLSGLQTFTEFNGDKVIITAIREDGPRGKAYYIDGRCSKIINWVYEYRLVQP